MADSIRMACGVEGPRGFTLDDFTRGISAQQNDMPQSAYSESENVVMAAPVEAAVTQMSAPKPAQGLYVQVASLSAIERAEALSNQLSNQLTDGARVLAAAGNFRVQVGPFESFDDASHCSLNCKDLAMRMRLLHVVKL